MAINAACKREFVGLVSRGIFPRLAAKATGYYLSAYEAEAERDPGFAEAFVQAKATAEREVAAMLDAVRDQAG